MSAVSPQIKELLRLIPNVDEVLCSLASPEASNAIVFTDVPKKMALQGIREVLAEIRVCILDGGIVPPESFAKETIISRCFEKIKEKMRPNFRSVLNGTGVVIHTNLGRSVLPPETLEMLFQTGGGYSNLEMDITTGKRGSRYSLVEDILCELTGAEAALVVNNNAAAVLLVLDSLAKEREVIVSRGQLVEIGGSFRIPDVMEKSGATLVEVGATNRTHLRDYERAVTPETALLLKVHTSNYKIIGFTSEVSLVDLVKFGQEHDLPVMEDLGSGCLLDLSVFGLPKEPTVGEVVKSGVDVVTFSGDKLLGGPQAGVIVGKKDIIDRVKKNPLNRALRIDKFTLAGLESILRFYYDEKKALSIIPTLAMLSISAPDIRRRAKRLLGRVKSKIEGKCLVTLVATESRVGGGALPEHGLPSWALSLSPLDRSVADVEKGLRLGEQSVIGRIENDTYLLDLRTIADRDIALLGHCICELFGVIV